MYPDFKSWSCNTDEKKAQRDIRKTQLKADFKRFFKYKIYEVKDGFGSTNNGNTACAAFARPDLFSKNYWCP